MIAIQILRRLAVYAPVASLRPLSIETDPGPAKGLPHLRLLSQDERTYRAVITIVLSPISSCTVSKSTPAITKRPAHLCGWVSWGDARGLGLSECDCELPARILNYFIALGMEQDGGPAVATASRGAPRRFCINRESLPATTTFPRANHSAGSNVVGQPSRLRTTRFEVAQILPCSHRIAPFSFEALPAKRQPTSGITFLSRSDRILARHRS